MGQHWVCGLGFWAQGLAVWASGFSVRGFCGLGRSVTVLRFWDVECRVLGLGT